MPGHDLDLFCKFQKRAVLLNFRDAITQRAD